VPPKTLVYRIFLYGLVSWLIPFVVALALTGLRESNRPLFESIMPVVVTSCAVTLGLRLIIQFDLRTVRTGAAIGLLWAIMNIALDLPLFSWGPMKMTLAEYFADIGLVYVIHPVVIMGMVRARHVP
jgi:hypothetical protein